MKQEHFMLMDFAPSNVGSGALLKLLVAVCSFVTLAAGAVNQDPSAAPPKPNILIIVADDLGFADVGFNGGKVIATPNLDKLAATGVVMENFRTCPMCSPTRAGMLTGKWPLRFGMMRAVVPPWSSYGLPSSENTLPELLAKNGYEKRALIGKWHLGHAKREYLPLSQGFTSFYGHYNGAIDYFEHTRDGERDWHRNEQTISESGYSTDLLAAEAVRFIQKEPDSKPWFMYLAFNAPHGPFQAKEEDLQKYSRLRLADRRAYAAMVDSMDQAIGRVLQAVDGRPDSTNTLVWFFSDNGGIPRVGSNAPWRGAKLSVYEGGTRVCAAIRWPAGGLAGGRKCKDLVGYIDVLPTVLAAAGTNAPPDTDGRNILPALRGQAPVPARAWFSYIHQAETAHASIHQLPWKLVAHGDVFQAGQSPAKDQELYNLETDPGETNNLAAAHPEIVERLQQKLSDFGKIQRVGVTSYEEGRRGFRAPKDWIVQ